MGMDMSEVLEAAHTYLRQVENIKGHGSVEVPSRLIKAIENAANEARAELSGEQKYRHVLPRC